MNINQMQSTSGRRVREDNTILNEAGVSGIKTVGSWEEAIDQGRAFEMSAVADGAYALAAYHDMVMTATTGGLAEMLFSGFFINSSNNPILIEFWEGASWSGGDVGVAPSAINRNRLSTNTSLATMELRAYYTTPIVRTGGTLLTTLTIYSGATAFNFANLANLMEKWGLNPDLSASVRLRNSAATPASIAARMLWSEETI